jgi:signal transduction histidine kinase
VLMNASVLASAWDDVVDVLDVHRQEGHEFSIARLSYEEMRETIPPLIRQIGDGARRIERIIGDLKDFVRPGPRAREPFQLNDVATHAVRLLQHVIRKRTDQFRLDLAANVPLVRGDAQQIEQVIVNLVINALEALPERSAAVTVRTASDAETNMVSCEVEDDGVGIPAENLSRLGEPFFTTKSAHGGTGLGIAIASSLVRLHNGRLRFSSEPGHGTRAIVEFPCFAPSPQPA